VEKTDHDSFVIEPLSWGTLRRSLKLVDYVFPVKEQGSERADVFFTASLFGLGRFYLRTKGYPHVQYWVAKDKKTGRVYGMVGLYTRTDDPEAYWGGWMCVDPRERGMAIGHELMMSAFGEAKRRGDRKYARLYTSTDPNEARANEMYDRIGLRVYKEEFDPVTGYTRLYRQVPLKKGSRPMRGISIRLCRSY
jgi:GNAT superfamily N-acetyltransferase